MLVITNTLEVAIEVSSFRKKGGEKRVRKSYKRGMRKMVVL